jgi:putative RNA 2'-phosphotransferase
MFGVWAIGRFFKVDLNYALPLGYPIKQGSAKCKPSKRRTLLILNCHPNMNEKQTKRISKFLSLILRHKPDSVGVELDENGWTDINVLLEKMNVAGTKIDRTVLDYVVDTNPKKRFAISDCGAKIRASQGHSVEIDLAYEPADPPQFLFHGTPQKIVPLIKAGGLKKMGRHHVHMNAEAEPCIEVAQRYGKPVVLKIAAAKMHNAGYEFFRSANSVWLTDNVPPEFIEFQQDKD